MQNRTETVFRFLDSPACAQLAALMWATMALWMAATATLEQPPAVTALYWALFAAETVCATAYFALTAHLRSVGRQMAARAGERN